MKDPENKSLEIPEDSKDVVADISLRLKEKILIVTLSDRFEGSKILYVAENISDLSKIVKGLCKKVKSKIHEMSEMSEKDLYKIEDAILRNHQIFKTEDHLRTGEPQSEPKQEPRPEISQEEWQKTLQEKYQILREATFKNFPDVWQAIEFALSVKNVIHIKGNTLPFIGIILGAPSSSKTLALEMLRKLTVTFYTDNFTAKSFVSHNTSVSQEQLAKIDMLPKIKDKLFITPELAPLFNGKDEDLLLILGIVTRIADGQGFESDSGAYGHRGYNGDIMFAWIGAAVDIPRKVYKHLSTLGPKLYFMRMQTKKKTENDYLNELKYGNFNDSKKQVEDALLDYLKWFDYCPTGEFALNIFKVKTEPSEDDDYSLKAIIKLGELLARLRGFAQTWETHGTQGSDYAYSKPIIENPSRAITNLRNLAVGHALSKGRPSITSDDIPLIIRTVLSTAPVERVMIFDLLLNKNGKLSTTQIETDLNVSRPTALRTMTELKVLGLVMMEMENENQYNSSQLIILKAEFKWFLSDEFNRLRDGFIPEKFEEVCKEKSPPPTLKKYDDIEDEFDFDSLENRFWEEFKEIERLENREPFSNLRLIGHIKLRNAIKKSSLSSPPIITDEVAERLLNKLVKEGKLIELRKGEYYKNDEKNSAATAAA
ncbi:hypothetical protein [Candidatus Nitrosocosmicus hydrocola]|uniref:hypothetical protein n=1 Tax=Candidatus Nitrosocosmicus hydrocola TaxID=1826872 RepID=UPI0011E5F404|nr:hypothetical protein [Candidatus Nitrosocosmicus hydrocola]